MAYQTFCHGHEGYVDRTEIADWTSGAEICVDCSEPEWERCFRCDASTTNYTQDYADACRHHGGRGGEDKDQWEANQ